MLEALFGHKKFKKKRFFRSGIFGKLAAYFGVVENQTRGSLHLHIILWLLGITPDSVRAFVQDPEQERQLVAFLESIVRELLPAKRSEHPEKPECY